ncbi:Uncharacterised protein [Yersinia enterocolitica]|uniref:Uncharacterized protein n=1 Tax=Yersinia pseudotuberculosis serotype O:3 (strain YPIII) TaxID=502800 RepID=A0A0H3B8J7_YERPY|nr:Uncharacterised protein [Yersinia enterocolitica]CNE74779.1 Uncharacterised protein [Yersinia enterocolitica]
MDTTITIFALLVGYWQSILSSLNVAILVLIVG